MDYQWYPGHMTKAMRQMKEDIKLIDLVIELLDARIPISSRNPDIDNLGKNKARLVLLNKSYRLLHHKCPNQMVLLFLLVYLLYKNDKSDEAQNNKWIQYFKDKGIIALKINSKNKQGIKDINNAVLTVCKEKIERDKRKGIKNRPVRAMVVGIPNVGKSTFINSFAGKACAKTGNRPGVTKGKQWIKINKNVELLDTPGILWPKFEDQAVGLRLALIGSIKEEILNTTEMAMEFIGFLKKSYPGVLVERYSVDESKENLEILEEIARIRGCLMKGNQTDIDKAGRLLLEDFRSLRLGKLSLEVPDAQ